MTFQLAIRTVEDMDFETMNILKGKIGEIEHMYKDVNDTLENGGRVLDYVDGATGRLSLVL